MKYNKIMIILNKYNNKIRIIHLELEKYKERMELLY